MKFLAKRTDEALGEELMNWGEEVLKNIKEVRIDLWISYPKVFAELIMPDTEVVADIFQGMKPINNEWEQSRKIFPQSSKSSKTIRKWIGEVMSYLDNRTTNGLVEGINNKLKLIKRIAYSFRFFDNFRTRIFLDWHFQC